jgi:hypothetical protein
VPQLRRLRGALTRGKYAPEPEGAEGKYAIIAWLNTTQQEQNVGGLNLGNRGPVCEGMFIWVFGLASRIAESTVSNRQDRSSHERSAHLLRRRRDHACRRTEHD